MTSTDDARLRAFFHQRLVPVADRLRQRHVSLFPTGPGPEGSWYTGPPGGPDFVELEDAGLAAALHARWAAQGLPELAALAGALLELAQELQAPADGDGGEVSPFMYVMY